MNLPKRKPNRIKSFDYNKIGAYFITICTENRRNTFWRSVGATIGRPHDIALSASGSIVNEAILQIPILYPAVTIDHYVIMPNHIHILLQIHGKGGRPMVAPTISTIVQQLKGYVSKQIGSSVWQKSFHDHIIRNRTDYQAIMEYIENNPFNWKEDCFYSE